MKEVSAYCNASRKGKWWKTINWSGRKREDWEATRDYNLGVCIYFFVRSVFFSKGYIFVLNIIHCVSFTLFLIKPSNVLKLEFFFQRSELLQMFQHKNHEKYTQIDQPFTIFPIKVLVFLLNLA